jgi:hypothetical protein
MKITWTEYNTIRKIKNHLAETGYTDISKYPDNKKDFYNFVTGMLTCGTCNKTMRPLRALFHHHIR